MQSQHAIEIEKSDQDADEQLRMLRRGLIGLSAVSSGRSTERDMSKIPFE